MLIPNKRAQAGGQRNAITIPIKVIGFTTNTYTKGGKLHTVDAIEGINLETGETVIASLTLNGKYANRVNEKNELTRPPLSRLRDGFKIASGEKLWVGKDDVILMSHAGQVGTTKEGKPIISAGWPDPLTYCNGARDSERVLSGMALAQYIPPYGENGRARAFVDILRYEDKVAVPDLDGLKAAITEIAARFEEKEPGRSPSFLIRGLDENGAVSGMAIPVSVTFKNVAENGGTPVMERRTPEEIAEAVLDVAKRLGHDLDKDHASYEVVPGERMSGGKNSVNLIKTASRSYVTESEAGVEYALKKTYLKRGTNRNGDDYSNIVDRVHVLDPYGKGEDPALFNGVGKSPLVYTPEIQAMIDAARASAGQAQQAQAAPAPAGPQTPPSAPPQPPFHTPAAPEPHPGFGDPDDPGFDPADPLAAFGGLDDGYGYDDGDIPAFS